MIRGVFLFFIGWVISHIITSILLAIIYSKTFYIFSPFSLVSYYFHSLSTFHKVSGLVQFMFWFYLFVSTIPFGIYHILNPDNTSKKNKYGYAKFAHKQLIKKMGLNFNEGLIFGILRRNLFLRLFFSFLAKKVIKSKEPLSTLLMAPPGTGKSAGIIIPTLLTLKNSVVVHDPKGELFDATYKARLNLGHKILVFDIDDINSVKFNPFAINKIPAEPEQIKPYIVNIANIIFKSNKENNNSNFFINAAKNAFIATASYLIYKEGFTSILKIREKILENDDIIFTFTKMKESGVEDFKIINKNLSKGLLNDVNSVLISSASPDQWSGVMGSLTEKLDYFSDPKIANIVDCEISSFSADSIRKEKTSIYLKVKDKDRAKLQPVISMIFESLGTELISKMPEPGDNQITFILDEFVRLGRVDVLTELTSISRGYNFNQIFVIQDLEQISNTYSKEYMSILESNCAYKIILKQNNFLTADRIAKIIGFKTDIRTSRSKKDSNIILSSQNNSDSTSTSEEGIYLVTPQDILNLNENQCLIIVQGFAATPILADICWWFKNKDLF